MNRIGGRVIARSDLDDILPYDAPQVDVPVKLNTNESPFPPSQSFTDELLREIGRLSLNRYPQRDAPALREALAHRMGKPTAHVWAANGSNEILLQCLLAFGGADRLAMTFEPTYVLHSLLTRISGTRHMRAPRSGDFSIDTQSAVDAVRHARPDIVFLCSPNNPSGGCDSEELVSGLCEAASGLVILDEAYVEFAEKNLGFLSDRFENLAVVRTFSKAWRLAGARIGYLAGSDEVIGQLVRVRLPYHLSSLTQAAGMVALRHADEMNSHIETIRHERHRISSELERTAAVTPYPSQANFVLFRCLTRPASEVWSALLERGVLIRDFSGMKGTEDCLRVSIGTPQQNERFLQALFEVVS